jgi:FAD/FMN-containing dehydrogenase
MFIAAWMPGDDKGDLHIQWAESSFKSIEPKIISLLLNFSFGDFRDYTKAGNGLLVYGSNLEKLKSIKEKYDPENLFSRSCNLQK